MAPNVDACDLFDSEEYSDVVIKSGDREFKCHKLLVARASDYFKKLLDPKGAFAESKEAVVELKEDSVDAIEAILRHIYGFDYEDIAELANDHTPVFHLRVYVAAHKYLLPALKTHALHSLQFEVNTLSSADEDPDKTTNIFKCITALAEHEMYNTEFLQDSTDLIKQHLVALMKLEDFRAWMVKDSGTALDLLLAAVTRGSSMTEHTLTTCLSCGKTRVYQMSVEDAEPAICDGIDRYGDVCGGNLKFTECWIPTPRTGNWTG